MDRASPRVALSPELIEKLQATPWRYGFFALMRRINANPASVGIQQPDARRPSLGEMQ